MEEEEDDEDVLHQLSKILGSKKQRLSPSAYVNTNFVHPTSASVERSFSLAKNISRDNSPLGKNTFKELMILNMNQHLWDVRDFEEAKAAYDH